MQTTEDGSDSSMSNDTDDPIRSQPSSPTRFPPYFVPRRPRVVKMRDLSPDTRNRLTREYYEVYDPWTGIRIAATLGILISLFTLFLVYKSKFNKTKNALLPSKKTSLYLYDDDLGDCDLDSIGSSEHSSSYGYTYPYNKNNIEDRMMYPFEEGFQLEEVFVKNQMVDVVALKVHKSGKRASKSGPKCEAFRITEDAARSLPCSPYQPKSQHRQETDVKVPRSPTFSTGPTSLTGSITSFGSSDASVGVNKHEPVLGKSTLDCENRKKPRKSSASDINPKSLVVTAKKPQDYRSRSTVVAIARRKRPS